MRVLVDGQEGGQLDPFDRGLQYGDGLFETIAVLGGLPRFFEWHLERLAEGARRLGFPRPEAELLSREIADIAGARCIVKLIVTRGSGPRGYRPPRQAQPRRIVGAWDWPAPPASAAAGARVGWCRTLLGRNPALAGLKHLNRLEQVLARAEWDDDDGLDEGLMCDDRGHVIGATQANLFAKIGGRWVTPRLDQSGVAGVMRRAFGAWQAAQGGAIEEREITRAEVRTAEALMLTNALKGAWPVRELDRKPFEIDADCNEFNAWLARG